MGEEYLNNAVRVLQENQGNEDSAILSQVKGLLVNYHDLLIRMDRARMFRALPNHPNKFIARLAQEVMSENPIPTTQVFRF